MDIFCKIINGEVSSYTIYEDDVVKCFLDVNPRCAGHTLIVPKKHYLDLDDIDLDTLNHIFEIAKMIKKRIEEKLHCNGIRLVQNNGILEEVKHYHLHLVPSYDVDKNFSVEEVYNILK